MCQREPQRREIAERGLRPPPLLEREAGLALPVDDHEPVVGAEELPHVEVAVHALQTVRHAEPLGEETVERRGDPRELLAQARHVVAAREPRDQPFPADRLAGHELLDGDEHALSRGERAEQRRRVGRAVERPQQLHLGVGAGLGSAVELEDMAVVERHDRVREIFRQEAVRRARFDARRACECRPERVDARALTAVPQGQCVDVHPAVIEDDLDELHRGALRTRWLDAVHGTQVRDGAVLAPEPASPRQQFRVDPGAGFS